MLRDFYSQSYFNIELIKINYQYTHHVRPIRGSYNFTLTTSILQGSPRVSHTLPLINTTTGNTDPDPNPVPNPHGSPRSEY